MGLNNSFGEERNNTKINLDITPKTTQFPLKMIKTSTSLSECFLATRSHKTEILKHSDVDHYTDRKMT